MINTTGKSHNHNQTLVKVSAAAVSMKLSQQLASIVMAYAHMGTISHYSGRTLLGTWGPAFSPDGVIVAISFSFIALGGCILGELGLSVTY